MKTIISPVVNLNGTEGMDLWRQWADVHRTLAVLTTDLYRAMPHGRDYPTGYLEAKRQHVEMIKTVEDLHQIVETIRASLHDQLLDRDAEIPL